MAIEGATDANNTANDVNQVVGGPGSSSSPDASLHRADSLNIVQTVDDDPSSSKQTLNADDKNKGAGKGDDTAKGDDDRFDKHPRFIELNTSVKELKDALKEERDARLRTEGELRSLREGKHEKPSKTDLPYKDISGLTDEQIVESFNDNPKGFLENLKAQIAHELTGSLKGELSKEDHKKAVDQTFADFEKEHPDLSTLWDKKEIQKFIKEHPGHNALSAYYALTDKDRIDKAVKEAVEKNTKEVEKRMLENIQAKKGAKVLGTGPAGGTVPTDDDLKDTKTQGGTNAALAARLTARRQGKLN